MSRRDDGLLAARVQDLLHQAQHRPAFLGFLDETQAAICEDVLARAAPGAALLWGGYPDAERKIAGVFPDYLEPMPEMFPIAPITFTFRKEDSLSHRDFLGSLMALGVERDSIGDILVGKGRCVVFVRKELERYFLENVTKIGRVGVSGFPGAEEPLPLEREFQVMTGVVASQRLDCMVAFLCRISREKAAGLITAGLVMRNHRETLSVSERLNEGDSISVRGSGKFIIDRLGPFTVKGRLSVSCRKFK